MNKVIIVLIALLVAPNIFFAAARNYKKEKKQIVEVKSPDKQLSATIKITKEGKLTYSVSSGKVLILNSSQLGITVDGIDLGSGATIISNPDKREINESYSIFGNHPQAHNHAFEYDIPLENGSKKYKLYVRVYNDAVAFRYSIPKGSQFFNGESTSWNLAAKPKKIAWSELSQCYEGFSHVTTPENIPLDKSIMAPVTIEMAGKFLSISEADCETFSDMALTFNGNGFKAVYPFQNEGWEIKKSIVDRSFMLDGKYLGESVTPWRTMIVANNLNELVNSDLLTNLSPAPEKGTDFSWVKPGRSLWQWWSTGAPIYEEQKNWYDAAAKLNWEYYLIDDGWRDWQKDGKDKWDLLAEVIAYGKTIGVKTNVWVDSKEMRHAKERRIYLEKIKAIGASGIKIDFIPDATSDIMQWYIGTMQDCAELKLLLNFHGSVKPTGLRRAYPNDITREAVRGNEYHMTRYNRIAPPEQDVCLPFTRPLAGATDVTPVIMDPRELNTTKFTWAHEFAQAIIYLSPITHFTDRYQYYIQSPMFDLFKEIPTTWDETKVLSCTSMGEVVAYARRKGNTWWIGAMNGAKDKEIKIPLSFLIKSATGTFIYDQFQNNCSIDRREFTVSPQETLTIKLASCGGFVARIK